MYLYKLSSKSTLIKERLFFYRKYGMDMNLCVCIWHFLFYILLLMMGAFLRNAERMGFNIFSTKG